MNVHPELGYFDEGLNLVEPELYAAARKPFGRAQTLPPAAYRSKIFADLEDEKIWTRTWVCVGTQQQIPNAGDLLPFTLGHHGIHVERQANGGLLARLIRRNMAAAGPFRRNVRPALRRNARSPPAVTAETAMSFTPPRWGRGRVSQVSIWEIGRRGCCRRKWRFGVHLFSSISIQIVSPSPDSLKAWQNGWRPISMPT